ncbi:hypothetical protein ACVMAJ_006894 [Bradyrhizobium sp. USDA 4448]
MMLPEQRAIIRSFAPERTGEAAIAFEDAVMNRIEAFLETGIVPAIDIQHVAAACAQELEFIAMWRTGAAPRYCLRRAER